MTNEAQKHLAKAKDYIAKGDESYGEGDKFYRKAKPEIDAAYAAGATQEVISRYLLKSQRWVSDVLAWDGKGTLYGNDTGRRQADQAKSVARNTPETLIGDPEARQALGRALDEHYTKQAQEAAGRKREREVERKGGEEEYVEHQDRQRLAEVVNVARGATSGWRFVAGQVKSLELDPGAVDTLANLADETEGFVSMIRSLLRGTEITDEDIAALIGEQS